MISFGRGGLAPDAVAALFDRLSSRATAVARGTAPDAGEWPPGDVLLMAADEEEFAARRARVRGPLDGVDVIIATSGSTDGTGHLVGLSWRALTASARATLDRLGGPGQWLTALPLQGVAGFQVVLRSAFAGVPPVVYAPARGFDAAGFARAVAGMRPDLPHYLSLVPTQLHRALESVPELLASFSAVLVGGAALAPELAGRAARARVPVVRTYGMTETCGGCVYDGVPLDGVRVRIDTNGLVRLAGPVLATRYVDAADPAAAVDPAAAAGGPVIPIAIEDGDRWLRTHDLGRFDGTGRLEVLGRADDVIISGGVNVNPVEVEAALGALGGAWVVVGVADAEWGQRVVAVSVDPAGRTRFTPHDLRAATASLPRAARPRSLVVLESLPTRPSGKIDRRAVAAEAAHRLGD